MPRRELKGWSDLNPKELEEAVLGLKKENLRETDEYMVRGTISDFEEAGLLSPKNAANLREYLAFVGKKK